jgi:hypothetical protein
LGIESGKLKTASVNAFLEAVPDIMHAIWAPREEIPLGEQPSPAAVEEQLALIVVDLFDSFPGEMLHAVPLPEGPRSSASPYFMLVCAKFVSLAHEMHPEWENALLLGASNALGDDDSDVVRVGCAALMMIVGHITLDPEFIGEILYCAKMALKKHAHVKVTADAVLVLFTVLMRLFPEAAAKPENVQLWLSAMPVETLLPGVGMVYEYLLELLGTPEMFELREDVLLKVVNIVAAVAGSPLLDRETDAGLRRYLTIILQNPEASELVNAQGEAFRATVASLLHAG